VAENHAVCAPPFVQAQVSLLAEFECCCTSVSSWAEHRDQDFSMLADRLLPKHNQLRSTTCVEADLD
jgi:hypothetical protein